MPVKFEPSGALDVGTDPSDLPSQMAGKVESSGAMTRCTNLRLDRPGMASTRHGSTKFNPSVSGDFAYVYSHESSAASGTGDQIIVLGGTGDLYGIYGVHAWEYTSHLTGTTGGPDDAEVFNGYIDQYVHTIIVQAGDRYIFADDKIYLNEYPIEGNLTDARWTGFNYNAYNSIVSAVFAVNGTDRKKIEGDVVSEWGIDPPASGPTLDNHADYSRTSGDWEADEVKAGEGGTLINSPATDVVIGKQYGDVNDRAIQVTGLSGFTINSITFSQASYRYDKLTQDVRIRIQGDSSNEPDGSDVVTEIVPVASFNVENPKITLSSPYAVTGTIWVIVDCINNETDYNFLKARSQSSGSPYLGGYRLNSGAWTISSSVAGPAFEIEYVPTGETAVTCVRFGQTYSPGSTGEAQYLYDWEYNVLSGDSQDVIDSQNYRATWFWELQSNYSITTSIGVVYTYVRKSGTTILAESNPSQESHVDGVQSAVYVSWVQPSDPQVTHVRLYRTVDDGATYYYAGEIDVSEGSGFVNITDESLGVSVAYDHDRPPNGAICIGPDFNGYCFVAKDNLLYFSKPQQPEYFPADYYIEVGSPDETIQALTFWDGILYAFTESKLYQIQGSGYQSYFPLPLPGGHGAIDANGVLAVRGLGIFHVSRDGLWLWNGSKDEKITHYRFEPTFRGETKGSLPGAGSDLSNCRMAFYKGRLYFIYPSSTATYADEMLVSDFDTQKVAHYDYGVEISALVVDDTNEYLLAADTSGFIWRLENTSATDDDGTAISWQIESKAFTDALRKYFPRAARWDINLGNGSTCNGYVVLDDSVHQTHSITESRNTKKRLVDGGNGDRLSIRLSGTGVVDIYSAEVE